MRHDLQSVFRALRREPRFTALAVLTFALGISAATAIFTVVNRVVLQAVPYPDPSRIVYFGWAWNRGAHSGSLSARKFQFWHDQTHVFDGVATFRSFTASFGFGQSEPDIQGLRVTADYLRVVGSTPAIGRLFSADETQLGGPPVAILSHQLWESHYGLDRAVLNKQVRVDGTLYTVIGVMPAGFRVAESFDQPQILLPLVFSPTDLEFKGNDYNVVARLAPHVTLAQARAAVAAVMPRFRTAYPDLIEPEDVGVILADYRDLFLGTYATALWILLGATGFVLLLTCANVANLLLARAIKRRREIGIRSALGATQGRLVRLFVTEGIVIALLAAVVGVAMSMWGLHTLVRLAPSVLRGGEEPRPDAVVLAFSIGLALLTGTVLGAVHAIPTLRTHKYQGRLPGVLIGAESALAIVLLIGAGLLITSLTRMLSVDLGFQRTGVLTATIPRPPAGYDSTARVWAFDQRLLARLHTIPGVLDAASVSALPFNGGLNMPVTVEGKPDAVIGAVYWRVVSPGYFRTLGITLVSGRDFSETDRDGTPGVVIVSKSVANQLWPGQDPIGQRLDVGRYRDKSMGAALDEPPREVIGVAADTRQIALAVAAPPFVFLPQAQVLPGLLSLPAFVVRYTGRSAVIGQAIHEVDPRMPQPRYETVDQLVSGSVEFERLIAMLMGLFAALALIVTCVGIYSVSSYAVASKTRDIGVRMALGAPTGRVVSGVIRDGMLPVVVGLAVGLVAAYMLVHLLTSLMYGVTPHDPATLAIVTVVLTVAALLGNWLPARRAARIDPLITLRGE